MRRLHCRRHWRTQIKHTVSSFDAADIDTECTFWARLTGSTVTEDDAWHSIRVNEARLEDARRPL